MSNEAPYACDLMNFVSPLYDRSLLGVRYYAIS